MGTLQSGA
uniref:Uncharacterized protein n=1 Tax=Anguilla anguilla TaxID=7936 RepID=A0A0E9PGZ2_ANGAN